MGDCSQFNQLNNNALSKSTAHDGQSHSAPSAPSPQKRCFPAITTAVGATAVPAP
jgi:hypothetical protein